MNGIVRKESSRTVAAEKLVRNTSDSSSRKLIVKGMKQGTGLTGWRVGVQQREAETGCRETVEASSGNLQENDDKLFIYPIPMGK